MKRALAIMLIAAAMVCALAACGSGSGGRADQSGDAIENGNGGADAGTTNGASVYGSGAYGARGSGTDRWRDGRVRGGDRGAYINGSDEPPVDPDDPAGTEDAAERFRYSLMLDNARVRDTDGFLLDGENPHHDTF